VKNCRQKCFPMNIHSSTPLFFLIFFIQFKCSFHHFHRAELLTANIIKIKVLSLNILEREMRVDENRQKWLFSTLLTLKNPEKGHEREWRTWSWVEDGTKSFHYTLNVNYVEHKSLERVGKIVKYYILCILWWWWFCVFLQSHSLYHQ
jgi:hypothetical protein